MAWQLAEAFEEAIDTFLQILDIQVDPEGLGPLLFGNLETLGKSSPMGPDADAKEGTGSSFALASLSSLFKGTSNVKGRVLQPERRDCGLS